MRILFFRTEKDLNSPAALSPILPSEELVNALATATVQPHNEALHAALVRALSDPSTKARFGAPMDQQRLRLTSLQAWLIDITDATLRDAVAGANALRPGNHRCLPSNQAPSQEPATILVDNPAVVEHLGRLLFGRQTLRAGVFQSDNTKLFTSKYFPIELADDGCGIFLDERLESRLRELGLVEPNDRIRRIIDKGGWGSLSSLKATIEVHLRTQSGDCTRLLHGTALVPMPPVRPEDAAEIIEQYWHTMRAAGLQSSVLGVRNAIVYHRGVTPFMRTLSITAVDRDRKSIIAQAATFAATIDSGRVARAAPTEATSQSTWMTQLYGDDDEFHGGDFISSLGIDGTEVLWRTFAPPPISFQKGSNNCWRQLASALSHTEREDAWRIYVEHAQLIQ